MINTLEDLEREVLTAVNTIVNRHSCNLILVEDVVILGVVVLQ